MPDGVNVSIAQMYELLQRIDRKVDSLVQTAEGLEERVADHEARLRVLEASKASQLSQVDERQRVAPATVIALIIAASTIVINVLLYTIDR